MIQNLLAQGIKKMERILQRHKVTVRTFRFVPEVPLRGLELLWVGFNCNTYYVSVCTCLHACVCVVANIINRSE